MRQRRGEYARRRAVLPGLLLLLAGAVLLSFWVGYYPLSPAEVAGAFLSRLGWEGEIAPQAVTIFWRVRLPRILSAALIGASLAAAGSAYQSRSEEHTSELQSHAY